MKIRTRKLIGTALMIVLVMGWAFLFMSLAQTRLGEGGKLWQFFYYVIAGLGWTIPAAVLIKWMSRPD
ncbi:hypothetical protein IZ6_14050 [Terrihabitans soli]|uniref:DUF2842 domain-containing protein n=1 Tax=Terrihabitans soli TaxID=708113 RepID=A0A6S6QUP3_9HYPH|nr:DUF2842 domain-containing protein [Terrihabitans soli]BCJ90670.1 hypothetical protein IZ6_14050 [Terrihabitans soli]